MSSDGSFFFLKWTLTVLFSSWTLESRWCACLWGLTGPQGAHPVCVLPVCALTARQDTEAVNHHHLHSSCFLSPESALLWKKKTTTHFFPWDASASLCWDFGNTGFYSGLCGPLLIGLLDDLPDGWWRGELSFFFFLKGSPERFHLVLAVPLRPAAVAVNCENVKLVDSLSPAESASLTGPVTALPIKGSYPSAMKKTSTWLPTMDDHANLDSTTENSNFTAWRNLCSRRAENESQFYHSFTPQVQFFVCIIIS